METQAGGVDGEIVVLRGKVGEQMGKRVRARGNEWWYRWEYGKKGRPEETSGAMGGQEARPWTEAVGLGYTVPSARSSCGRSWSWCGRR